MSNCRFFVCLGHSGCGGRPRRAQEEEEAEGEGEGEGEEESQAEDKVGLKN